jgi:hypothetical protein
MTRTFEQWWKTIPEEIRYKAQKGHEGKPLLNQINYIWVTNMLNKKSELNPTASELLEWIRTGQIELKPKSG